MLTKIIYYSTLKILIKTLWLNTLNGLDYEWQSKKNFFPGIRLNSKWENAFKNDWTILRPPSNKKKRNSTPYDNEFVKKDLLPSQVHVHRNC